MALYKLSDEEKRIRKNEKSRVYREKNYERIKAKRTTPEEKLKQRLNYIKTMTPEKRKLMMKFMGYIQILISVIFVENHLKNETIDIWITTIKPGSFVMYFVQVVIIKTSG